MRYIYIRIRDIYPHERQIYTLDTYLHNSQIPKYWMII